MFSCVHGPCSIGRWWLDRAAPLVPVDDDVVEWLRCLAPTGNDDQTEQEKGGDPRGRTCWVLLVACCLCVGDGRWEIAGSGK